MQARRGTAGCVVTLAELLLVRPSIELAGCGVTLAELLLVRPSIELAQWQGLRVHRCRRAPYDL